MYVSKSKKVIINSSDGSLTRLANKYRDLNSKLKNIKEARTDSLELLRDRVLSEFDPMDSDKTRIIKTGSLRISVNKDTLRKVIKTDMEAVFENICEIYKMSRADLDAIVELNSKEVETFVKPAVKVE
jgi:chaperonin cofactor prefoldin